MKKSLFSALVASALLSGCGTLALQTNVKMTRTVWLKPNPIAKATVFISLKNISGEKLHILSQLKDKLRQKNYIIVDSSSNADYVVMINVLFANNLKEATNISAAGSAGVASGVIAAAGGSDGGDSLLVGASVALASGLIGHALADETYRAVVDILIDEKVKSSDHTIAMNPNESVMGSGYKEHKTRVLAEAVQTNLKLNEALPILSKDISTQISNIF